MANVHHFQDFELTPGHEFDAVINGKRKTFRVKDIAVNPDTLVAQIEAIGDDDEVELFCDVPTAFIY